MAAWHAAGGLDYLKRAAELFPDDPRVQVAVLNMNLFPEQQREWLDRLKQSDPENPMGNYLSARDYLHGGNPEQALKELKDATGKSKYNDYTLARLQDTEEMYMQAGHSAAEAKAIAGSSITLPQVTQLRDLGRQLATLQQNYLAAGDQSGAEQLARMGDTLSRDMGGERAGAGVLINQLAGMAVEKSLLKGLPPDSEPDFLSTSVQQRLAQIEELKMQSRTLVPLLDQMLLRGNEAEIIGYFDRMEMYGELRALKWLAGRTPAFLRDRPGPIHG